MCQPVFLPKPAGAEPTQSETYRRLGLNDTQIRLIAEAFPKRDYYLPIASRQPPI